MDISRFKDVIQKLNVFKSYSSLLVPAVIGLVSVLLFIPTQLMSSKLKKQIVNESITKGKQVKSLSISAVTLEQWKEEQKYQQAYERDADRTALSAKQSSRRQLLSYKIFPEPKDTSMLIFEEFGQRYRAGIEELIGRVNGRDCPTEAELRRSLQSSSGSRPGTGRRRSYWRSGEVDVAITDILCQEKAESASVYANPADLDGYEFWGKREDKSDKVNKFEYTGIGDAVKDCWFWQLGYWIIEDVIDTIGSVNSGSNSVFTSPVKRLLSTSFTRRNQMSRFGKKSGDNKPSYVFSIEDELTASCTGRFSNDDIDVVHFNVAVVVSTEAVLPFMQQICSAKEHKFRGFFGGEQEQTLKHNQITILESRITPVYREGETHNLYRYGEDAVVELDLTCEYIFNKSAYDGIKPESVEKEHKS